MNLLGKIMTLMILLLSICFLMIAVMANASYMNWKDKAMELKAEIERVNRQKLVILDESQKKDQRIKTEIIARMLRIQQLESKAQLAEANLKTRVDELSARFSESQQRLAVATQANERLKEQDKEVQELRDQVQTFVQDIATQRRNVVALTNRIYELEGTERSLEALQAELVNEVTARRKVMTKAGLLVTSLTDHIPPLVEGLIVDVRENTIQVNLGTDDGLRQGHTLDIYRDDKYVGSAVVSYTEENESAALINPDLTKVAVELGDKVTTNWVRSQN